MSEKNKLMYNLLLIHEKLSEVDSFIHIKMNIESLDINDSNYKKLLGDTDLLVKILEAFSKRPK